MISPDKLQMAVETLCQSLIYDANPNIRVKAAEALGQLGSEIAIPTLCQAWEQDRNLSVRLAAADAMVQIIQPAMTDPSKNQPTFNINQVGNINTGDVSIQGDQIGVQQNYGTEQTFEQLLNDYTQFIAALQQQHPVATEATAIQIIDAEFKELERTQPLRWQNFSI